MVNLYYQNNHSLETYYRNLLTKILIHKEFEKQNYPTIFKITTDRFLELRKQIILLFPKETEFQTIYFFPYAKKHSSGKLWDSYNHFKSKLNKLRNEESQVTVNTTEVSTDLKEKLDYLYKNISDWDKVKQYWKETHKQRSSILDSNIAVGEYMNKFPVLATSKGSILLLQDFDTLNSDSTNKLFASWEVFDKKLITFGKERIKTGCQLSTIDSLTQPKKHIVEIINLKNKFRGLLLLPHLLNKSSYIKGGAKRKRLSTQEIADSFFCLVSVSLHFISLILNNSIIFEISFLS